MPCFEQVCAYPGHMCVLMSAVISNALESRCWKGCLSADCFTHMVIMFSVSIVASHRCCCALTSLFVLFAVPCGPATLCWGTLCCAQEYNADAVMHFGMHGTVEWLPGSPLGNTGGWAAAVCAVLRPEGWCNPDSAVFSSMLHAGIACPPLPISPSAPSPVCPPLSPRPQVCPGVMCCWSRCPPCIAASLLDLPLCHPHPLTLPPTHPPAVLLPPLPPPPTHTGLSWSDVL
jgi:hypothetical protein